jgi:hypothetical protein
MRRTRTTRKRTAMNIDLAYFGEPKLQFGGYFEYDDAKTGLAEFGPFGKCIDGLHKETIRLGFVGTRETISGAHEWVEECGHYIQSENVKKTIVDKAGTLFVDDDTVVTERLRLEKMLNRDFVGFNRDTPFDACFQTNVRWDNPIEAREIDKVLKIEDKADRISKLVDLIASHVESLAKTSPRPDIIVIALTDEMVKLAERVRINGNSYLDFRRALKAICMQWDVPIQLLQSRTVVGKGDVQEKATRAWNFCSAQYYKADGVPWRPTALERDTCYIGVSFYVAHDLSDRLTMRASLAQAFDYLGQGLVLRGDPFEWDVQELGRSPHLTQAAAYDLLKRTLENYLRISHLPPRRVLIHKTSQFWWNDHPQHNEVDGFYQAIDEVFPRCETDFVAIKQTGVRLFREGMYPPLRGTYLCLEGDQHFLYTMGYTPYLETYPGSYVPEPWQITQHLGGSGPKDLLKEVLALTKMNVNNCSYADGWPITLSFAKMIGEIMKHVPEEGVVQSQYKFYM